MLTCAAWVVVPRSRTWRMRLYILTHFRQRLGLLEIGTEQFLLRQMPVALGGHRPAGSRPAVAEPDFHLGHAVARMPLVPRWAPLRRLRVERGDVRGLSRNPVHLFSVLAPDTREALPCAITVVPSARCGPLAAS